MPYFLFVKDEDRYIVGWLSKLKLNIHVKDLEVLSQMFTHNTICHSLYSLGIQEVPYPTWDTHMQRECFSLLSDLSPQIDRFYNQKVVIKGTSIYVFLTLEKLLYQDTTDIVQRAQPKSTLNQTEKVPAFQSSINYAF